MSAFLLIVLVGVAILVTVRSARRGLSDRHTVEEHHRTLGTLKEIAERQETDGGLSSRPARIVPPPAQPHIRVMPPGGQAAPAGQPTATPGQPVRWSPAQPPAAEPEPPAAAPAEMTPPVEPASPVEAVPWVEPGAPISASPLSALQGDIPPLSAPLTPPPRAPSRPPPVPPEPAAPLVALTVSGGEVPPEPRPPSRKWVIAGVSAAATILVAVGAVTLLATLIGSGGHHPPSPATAAAPTIPPTTVSPPTTAPPQAAPQAAPQAPAVLIDSNSQGARYSLEPSAASIELVPTSTCWVQVRTGSATGRVVFQGTMHAGDHLPLPATGPVWLRLGNPPAISIVVNGTPLHLVTASVVQPYNLELQPST